MLLHDYYSKNPLNNSPFGVRNPQWRPNKCAPNYAPAWLHGYKCCHFLNCTVIVEEVVVKEEEEGKGEHNCSIQQFALWNLTGSGEWECCGQIDEQSCVEQSYWERMKNDSIVAMM